MKILSCLTILLLCGCSVHPIIRSNVTFPDVISPIYYLDTFQIQNPVVVFIKSIPYITTEAILKDTLNKTALEERKGVIRYLTQKLGEMKSGEYVEIYCIPRVDKSFFALHYENQRLFIEDNLYLADSINGIAVFRFDLQPHNFLLTLVAKTENTEPYIEGWGEERSFTYDEAFDDNNITLKDDVIIDIIYSKDYVFALAPLFSNKDKKALLRREVSRYNEPPIF